MEKGNQLLGGKSFSRLIWDESRQETGESGAGRGGELFTNMLGALRRKRPVCRAALWYLVSCTV